MPRTWRTTLDANIYEDQHGWEILITRHGRTRRKRFPRKDGKMTLGALRSERDRMIDDLTVTIAATKPGTLAGDVPIYLQTIPAGRARDDRARELKPWVKEFGAWRRDQILAPNVRAQLATWHADGKQPSTLNHRRQALRSLYKTLDGPDAQTPCDHVPKYPERRAIRVLPLACVLAILRRVTPTKTGARIKVLARTGLPHAQIARLQPADLNLAARVMHVTPRRKGAGTPAKTLPLTYAAVRALAQFDRLNAWGSFSRHSLRKSFRLAVSKAIAHWPPEKGPWPASAKLRPYDLRHAFLTEVYRRTKDLRATAELGLHASLTMTARYAESAVTDTASAARDAMDGLALRQNRRKT